MRIQWDILSCECFCQIKYENGPDHQQLNRDRPENGQEEDLSDIDDQAEHDNMWITDCGSSDGSEMSIDNEDSSREGEDGNIDINHTGQQCSRG
jgi:hypothetical protein